MSIEQQPPKHNEVPVESLPPFPHNAEDTVIPPPEHRDDKDSKKRLLTPKRLIGAATAAIVLGVGGFAGVKALGGSADEHQPGKKDQGTHLVLGADGNPVEYVQFEYDPNYTGGTPPASMDRNHDGTPDNLTDVNENGVTDSKELWDQLDNEFVDSEAASSAETEAGASEQDKADMGEIIATFPDFDKFNVHWRAEYIKLDPVVKERVMFAVHHPGEYEAAAGMTAEQAWEADVYYQFSRTVEDIQG